MKKLLSLPDPPTAIVICHNLTCIGAVRYCRENGIRIPEDISIIGWESEQVSNFLRPRQTTLAQNFPKLAAESLNLLEHLMNGTPHQRNVLVEYRLIERDSVAVL